MSTRTYEKLKDKLCYELDEIAKKDSWSSGDLDMTHKLTDTIKNIHKIEKLEEDLGYSGDGDWRAEGRYSRGNGRAGSHYTGGYYSHDGDGNYSGGRYSRNGRYSMDDGRDMFGRGMRSMMANEAYNPNEREMMRNAYNNMY